MFHAIAAYEPWMTNPDRPCATEDPEHWFRGIADSKRSRDRAGQLCANCPVLLECRDYAVDDSALTGIWGGLIPQQRVEIRKERARG